MAQKTDAHHGKDHAPGGADPIPNWPTGGTGSCDCGLVVTGISSDSCYGWSTSGEPRINFIDPFAGSLAHPIDFSYDHWNNIFVVNNNLSTTRSPIFKFNSVGTFIMEQGIPGNGSADGRCSSPTGACVAGDSLFIVDAGNDRIQEWDLFGNFVAKWGTTGTGNGQFDFDAGTKFSSICFDGTHLYVTDPGNNRVQKFTTGGVYVTKWGSSGTATGQFTRPNGIAAAPDGTIYVVDDFYNPGTGNNARVQHFSNTGTYIDQYVSPNAGGSADGDLFHPNGIDIDEDGNIYIADEYNFRVQKFDSSFTWVQTFESLPTNIQGIAVRPNAVAV